MSLRAIRRALTAAFAAAIPTSAGNVAFENIPFREPGGNWFRLSFLPASRDAVELGTSGQDREDGLFQIDVNRPKGEGSGAALDTELELRPVFYAGALLTDADTGQEVRILSLTTTAGREVDGFYRTSFTVRWTARVNRT